MPNKLNGMGRANAESLITSGKVNNTADWSWTAADEDKALGNNDWGTYGKSFLGNDPSQSNDTKGHWKYPFAKEGVVYRSALVAIRTRASAQGDTEVFDAAGTLLNSIDNKEGSSNNMARFRPANRVVAKASPIYRCTAKAGVGEILLYGVIGETFFSEGITAKQFSDDLKGLGPISQINLRINSDGGDVFQGRTIYSILAEHKAKVTVYVDGLAASIASLIAMAGDEIIMADGSFMMIHNAWGMSIGDANEMRRTAALLDSVSGTLVDTYAARTKQPRDQIKAWMDAETWMPAQESKDRGFATVVGEPVRAAALVSNPDIFKHLPVSLRPNRSAALAKIAAMRSI